MAAWSLENISVFRQRLGAVLACSQVSWDRGESIGYYTGLGQRILVELNPNILVWDAVIMYTVHCTLYRVWC